MGRGGRSKQTRDSGVAGSLVAVEHEGEGKWLCSWMVAGLECASTVWWSGGSPVTASEVSVHTVGGEVGEGGGDRVRGEVGRRLPKAVLEDVGRQGDRWRDGEGQRQRKR